MDPIAKESLLYDIYGELLTSRQKEVIRLYHEENWSLSEIAQEFGISRQGVHDALKSAENALAQYEEKLGLLEKMEKQHAGILGLQHAVNVLKDIETQDVRISEALSQMESAMKELDQ